MQRLINLTPSRPLSIALSIIPFVLILLAYQIGSDMRKAENEQDKLLPSFTEIAIAIDRMALEPSKRSGEYLFWRDTQSSLSRLVKGVSIAAFIGLIVGLAAGAIPLIAAPLKPLITAVSLGGTLYAIYYTVETYSDSSSEFEKSVHHVTISF